MLVIKDVPQSLREPLLPPEILELNEEISRVDAILNDERFICPFIERYNTTLGRPTIPVEIYLRLMYLKFRYQLGYETLVAEVSDRIKWHKFCHIPLEKKVPHSTTLI